MCGIPEENDTDNGDQRKAKTVEQIRLFLTETKRDKNILNGVAAATVLAVAFLFGFYH